MRQVCRCAGEAGVHVRQVYTQGRCAGEVGVEMS